jgi:hypothetical protein
MCPGGNINLRVEIPSGTNALASCGFESLSSRPGDASMQGVVSKLKSMFSQTPIKNIEE